MYATFIAHCTIIALTVFLLRLRDFTNLKEFIKPALQAVKNFCKKNPLVEIHKKDNNKTTRLLFWGKGFIIVCFQTAHSELISFGGTFWLFSIFFEAPQISL